MKRKLAARLVILALLIALGFSIELLGLLDVDAMLALARQYTRYWWLAPLIVLLQSLLFTFALAGSLFLWVAALLYPPLTATLMLTAGSVLGGVGAYFLSRYLTVDVRTRIERSRAYRLLHASNDFFTLFALRVFPGFPHSVVNYSAGILRADLTHFVIAAILGIALKSYIYARVIDSAASGVTIDLLLDVSVLGPLLLLSLLSLGGVYLNYRFRRGERRNS